MKDFYDKILFVVAFVLFGASIAWYFMGGEGAGKAPGNDIVINDTAYKPVERKEDPDAGKTWPKPDSYEPLKQLSKKRRKQQEFLVEMFSPPKIYFNEEHKAFTLEYKELPPPKFGLAFERFNRELYRFKMKGYVKGPNDKYLLQVIDRENDGLWPCWIGATDSSREASIVSFEVIEKEEKGGKIRYGEVVIQDDREGRQVTLKEKEDKFTSKLDIYFYDELNPSVTFKKHSTGDVMEIGKVRYTVMDFDLEANTVTVKKEDPELIGPETVTLQATPLANSPTSALSTNNL